MEKTSRDRLAGIITSSIQDACAHWGVTVESLASSVGELETVAVIGFTGDTIRGSLGLGVERSFLRHMAAGASDELAEDWLGEATNQLLGRTKNRLVAHGVAVAVALPMVLRGLRIQVSQGDSGVLMFPVATSAGSLVVWFDVKPEASFALHAPLLDAEPCAAEGEMVLF